MPPIVERDGDGLVAGIVLAAGAGSRFGGGKLLAQLDGRPIVRHVVDAAVAAGLDPILVVVPPDESVRPDELAPAIALVNPTPEEGLSSSVRVGLHGLQAAADVDAVVILAGDQPEVRASVIDDLRTAAASAEQPIVIPHYADDSNPNPVLVGRAGWPLADELTGDRGFGPLIAEHPELVLEVQVDGTNPDVDTAEDLESLVAARWAARVRADRDQVDRVREVPDGPDFYAPITSLFRADPNRSDERVLEILASLVVPGETWLDIGAGAGRFALPLSLVTHEVIAIDSSSAMLDALGEQMAAQGVRNIRPIQARWPLDPELVAVVGPMPLADVSLMAHVGYDIEDIVRFVDSMELATRRLCVAILMDRTPSSVADVFWPPVHGEERVALPALPEFLELLAARGHEPTITMLEREPRRFATAGELESFLRRRLWITPGGPHEDHFRAAANELIVETPEGFGLRDQAPIPLGIVTWPPVA
jgi:CTP:molybdopterin cytidylyltransferase MocA